MNRLPVVFAALVSFFAAAAPVRAHPSIDNGMEVVTYPDRIAIRAKISLTAIDIANTIDEVAGNAIDPAKLKKAVDAHGPYLLAHLHVSADGVAARGKLLSASPPTEAATWAELDQLEATYELEYAFAKPRPAKVRLDQDVLKEFSRLGQPWMVMFVVQARQSNEKEFSQLLLSNDEPLDIACRWDNAFATTTTTPTNTGPANAVVVKTTTFAVARQYTIHGFEHIITGYDHLLFVAALVLAATRLWDLVTVVTAFAVAHTLTLTLSVLDLVRLPASVVEPVIAASIVFVALQNVIFPQQARGRARLAVAFTFGLFHGLGFAGGLLHAMEGMPAVNLAVALIAFTLGVEAAHQVLIVPLFLLLRPLRRGGEDAVEGDAMPRATLPIRVASLAISLAGTFYLVQALRRP